MNIRSYGRSSSPRSRSRGASTASGRGLGGFPRRWCALTCGGVAEPDFLAATHEIAVAGWERVRDAGALTCAGFNRYRRGIMALMREEVARAALG